MFRSARLLVSKALDISEVQCVWAEQCGLHDRILERKKEQGVVNRLTLTSSVYLKQSLKVRDQ